jgi:hypothetical protein
MKNNPNENKTQPILSSLGLRVNFDALNSIYPIFYLRLSYTINPLTDLFSNGLCTL